jgi:magnesium chelatase family protein
MVTQYLGRVSGPLLDRIDMHVEMAAVTFGEMTLFQAAEDSTTVAGRVSSAWAREQRRFEGHAHVLCNAQMRLPEIRRHCVLKARPLGLLRMAMSRLNLSPRAYHRVLRIARTIADLAGVDEIAEAHVAEAIAYRVLDRGRGG